MGQATFKIEANFKLLNNRMKKLEVAAYTAAEKAMSAAMKHAEVDARDLARWRSPGEYTEMDSGGDLWTWTATGFAASTIKAFVATSAGHSPIVDIDGGTSHVFRERANGGFTVYEHDHITDSSLVNIDVPNTPYQVTGTVTMYAAYAPWLQRKEMNGASWGIPSAGLPVTVEVLAMNWYSYYVPSIIKPTFARWIRQAAK